LRRKCAKAYVTMHLQESQEIKNHPMFTYSNENVVLRGDLVEINGLKTAWFNGKRCLIHGPDPKAEGCFAVQFSSDPKDVKSFKQDNLSYLGEVNPGNAVLRMMRLNEGTDDEEFFQGILECTRDIKMLRSYMVNVLLLLAQTC